jgi:hypothetical protein
MKNFVLIIFILLIVTHKSTAQSQYLVLTDTVDNNTKIFKGIITKKDLTNETSFNWYAESRRTYTHADISAVNAFKNNADKIYFIVFCGTWCEDSHFVLPKFFKIQKPRPSLKTGLLFSQLTETKRQQAVSPRQ